jgi:hypothetical protein
LDCEKRKGVAGESRKYIFLAKTLTAELVQQQRHLAPMQRQAWSLAKFVAQRHVQRSMTTQAARQRHRGFRRYAELGATACLAVVAGAVGTWQLVDRKRAIILEEHLSQGSSLLSSIFILLY